MDLIDRISLIRMDEEDAEVLADISKRAFDTDVDVGAPNPEGGPPGYDDPEFQVSVMNYLDCYKVMLDDEVVGGLYVGPGEEHRVMERIFVDPNQHRRGIGTRAMELVHGMYPVVKLWSLGTPEWNVRTKEFYERLGYVQVGWDHGEPKFRGRWYDKVVDPEDPYVWASIGDLKDGVRNVDVEGTVEEKSMARGVRSRRGEDLSVANAGLSDDSGRIVLVLWNQQIRNVSVGDRLRVENGYVNSFRGVTQLNIGRAGRLIKPI
ncbi:MAG TPA: GNAT family N-acetyltransferase [Patescibacteria group bacterium]|nr:GNAT family N-acetyltransferase [Patescibacteria group bacterium]